VAPLQRTDFYQAALQLMAAGGAVQVTIDNLCEALQVTKGSFYHHFENRSAFVRQTLLHWEQVQGRSLVDEALRVPDARKRIGVLEQLAAGLDHDAERAIRQLAATDSFANEVRQRVDRDRLAVVARTIEEAGVGGTDAELIADVGFTILVGAQETGERPDPGRVTRLLAQYRVWVEAELDARL
jgi:AcrR family transcriptional regulator